VSAPLIGVVLDEQAGIIGRRKRDLLPGSYAAELLAGPEDRLLKKFGEEVAEVVAAAAAHDRGQLRWEAADLVCHLLVVMAREGVDLDDLAAELVARRGED
jgi:phosphoribosyl-ATP pyrophosphohydrolase